MSQLSHNGVMFSLLLTPFITEDFNFLETHLLFSFHRSDIPVPVHFLPLCIPVTSGGWINTLSSASTHWQVIASLITFQPLLPVWTGLCLIWPDCLPVNTSIVCTNTERYPNGVLCLPVVGSFSGNSAVQCSRLYPTTPGSGPQKTAHYNIILMVSDILKKYIVVCHSPQEPRSRSKAQGSWRSGTTIKSVSIIISLCVFGLWVKTRNNKSTSTKCKLSLKPQKTCQLQYSKYQRCQQN